MSYWGIKPNNLREVLAEIGLAPSHVSDEFVKALMEYDEGQDDKRERDTFVADSLKDYDR